jgi:hypothetical protein
MDIFLPCDHPLSIKLQNTWFQIEEKCTWDSSVGPVACLSIVSGIASARASEVLGGIPEKISLLNLAIYRCGVRSDETPSLSFQKRSPYPC